MAENTNLAILAQGAQPYSPTLAGRIAEYLRQVYVGGRYGSPCSSCGGSCGNGPDPHGYKPRGIKHLQNIIQQSS